MTLVRPLSDALVVARAIPAEYNTHLRTVVIAPQANLHRESVDGEAAVIGSYNPSTGGSFDIPDREALFVLDIPSVKLLMRDADLEVYSRSIGVDGTVAPVGGYKNRLTASTLSFKAGTTYPLSSQFHGRDVKVGDTVVYSATVSSTVYTHRTTVQDILAVVAAASVGAAASNGGNKAGQSASAAFSQVSGAINWVTATSDASAYNDLNGGVNRTYTAIVIVGGAPSSARLQIISSDGLDNQASITPAAFSSPTSIGTKGLTTTFVLDNGRTPDSGVPTSLFVVGQTFQVIAAGAFTAPAATSGGTYTGDSTYTLILTVTRGGLYADPLPPQITVSSSTGVDSSGPTSILSAGTNYAVGTKGAVVQFNLTGLNKDDIYYITVTAEADTQLRTLLLADDLPTDLQGVADGDLSIRVVEPLVEIRPFRRDQSPAYNWQLADPQVVVEAGITATSPDGSLVDENGVTRYVPVQAGTMVVEYREWDRNAASRIRPIVTTEDAISELVSVGLDNPAGYAAGKQLQCANGFEVGTIGVIDPSSVSSWGDAISAIAYAENCYHIALATDQVAVIDLLIAHLEQQNSSTVECFRVGVVSLELPDILPVVTPLTTSDAAVCLLTISDNPSIANTQYNLVTSANGKFITNGVKAGDKLRTAYSTDPYGVETYTEFTVSSVINENTLVTVTSSVTPYSIPQRGEIHRVATARDKGDYAKAIVATRRSKYLRICIPDSVVDSNGNTVPGYYLAASYAACLSVVAPHQPFNYFEIPGYSRVYGSGNYFQPSQLKEMEAAGLTVFDDNGDGLVHVRKSVTTDNSTQTLSEEVLVRQEHALIFVMRSKLSYYRGQSNNVPSVVAKMTLDAQGAIRLANSETMIPRLGGLIASDAIAKARPHASDPALAVVEITGSRPYPMDDFQVSFLTPVGS
jgi:hypothetical protein